MLATVMAPEKETVQVTGPDRDVHTAKDALRSAILAARSARGDVERASAGDRFAGIGVARWGSARAVAAYLSFGSEPPTRQLLESLARAGVEVLVPVVVGELLEWVVFDPAHLPAPGALGIPEPTGPRLGAEALARVDAVLVPALAADRRGNRLGRGRGYYDRALASVAAQVVAVVYDDELLASVPAEPHDRQVDAILTPSGWLDVPGA
jgi:5-formyltetrahydrofolate cyclo-ligase